MTSNLPCNHSIAVRSTSSDVSQVCERILCEVKTNNFNDEDVFAVHLALEETFLNAIKHGNKMDPAKEVRVDYTINQEKVEISVTDQGEGFDPHAIPDPRSGENLYKPEGRGLLLIRAYMDVVEFNERGNSVHMVRYKEKPSLKARGRSRT